LPTCPQSPSVFPLPSGLRWHNCVGEQNYSNGARYVGEFREGNRHGQGTYTLPDSSKYVGEWREGYRHGLGIEYKSYGSVDRSGRWEYNSLVQSYALDTARFPFNPPAQVAAAPLTDPSKAERDRQAAEAEAERKRRQEFEVERRKRQQPEAQPEAERGRRAEEESRRRMQPNSTGTGFAVAAGILITNQHVVAQCQRLEIVSADGRRAARIIDSDESVDLALLRVTDLGGALAPVRRVGTVRLGEPAYAFGFPLTGLLSEGGNFTSGVVSSLRGIRDSGSQIQISTPVQSGNSGGALADASGAVIGVVVGKLNATAVARATGDIPQNVNFAVSLQALSDFLRRNNVTTRTAERGAPLDTAQLAEMMRGFTHRIECLDAPGLTVQASPGGRTAGEASNTTVVLQNRSQETIFRIYVSPQNSNRWGTDLLGARILSAGESFTLSPPATQGCIFDVRVEYRRGGHEQKEQQDFCSLLVLVFTGAASSSPVASDPNWVMVTEGSSGDRVYIAPGTIRREANLRRYWEIVDRASPKGPRSLRSFNEVDCREERSRIIQITAFTGSMATGTILTTEYDAGRWQQVPPGTVGESMMRYVCAR
jgi:S1-C subfamily serine protease